MRGRLLRITEDCGGRHNSIIIPATGLVEFQRLLDEMVKPLRKQSLQAKADAPEVSRKKSVCRRKVR